MLANHTGEGIADRTPQADEIGVPSHNPSKKGVPRRTDGVWIEGDIDTAGQQVLRRWGCRVPVRKSIVPLAALSSQGSRSRSLGSTGSGSSDCAFSTRALSLAVESTDFDVLQ